MRWLGFVLIVLSCLMLAIGCSEKGGGLRFTNQPPMTFITYGPKWQDTTGYKVQLYWYGKDVDGEISYFEVATVRDLDSVPECGLEDNLPWGRTTSGESTFVVVANSSVDTTQLGGYSDTVSQWTPWAVFIRAVDNDGQADPCPESAFFIAETFIPKVTVEVPRHPDKLLAGHPEYILRADFRLVPPIAYFQWKGEDPDGVDEYLKYKYLVIEADSVGTCWDTVGTDIWRALDVSRIPPFSKESETHRVGYWSKWVPSDSIKVIGYDLTTYGGDSVYLFVTAMDEAGGYIPREIFTRYDMRRSFAALAVAKASEGCQPIVNAGFLGICNKSTTFHVFQGTRLKLAFWASEDREKARLTDDYRYYFDYEDNTDPASRWIWTKVTNRTVAANPEWVVRVPEKDGKHVDWVLDTPGPHEFVVETKDFTGKVKRLTLSLQVLGGPDPTKRLIVLIDEAYNNNLPQDPARPKINYDSTLTAFWRDVLEGLPHYVFDTHVDGDVTKIIETLGRATTIIWNIEDNVDQGGLRQLYKCWTEKGAYLHSYVKLGGNLIIIGNDATLSCFPWTVEQAQTDRKMYSKYNLPDILDFRPYPPNLASGVTDTVYHFLWDVCGIDTMKIFREVSIKTITKLIPCELSGVDWQDTVEVDSSRRVGFRDTIPTIPVYPPLYIASWRTPDDKELPFRTDPELMFSTLCETYTGQVKNRCNDNAFVGIYVPASQGYGHVAYLAVDPFFFDEDKMKSIILRLLEKFGETGQ